MKLTQIAIEGIGAGRAIQLDRLSQDLNVVFCANGTGKARLKSFLRYTLFGTENWNDEYFGNSFSSNDFGSGNSAGSFVEVLHNATQYRVHRDNRTGMADQVIIQPLNGQTHTTGTTSTTTSQLVQGVDGTAYDTFYNVSISETHSLVQRLIEQIEMRFGVQFGRSNWNHHLPYETWKSEANARNAQLNSLKSRQEQLGHEKTRLTVEIERHENEHRSRVNSLSHKIDAQQSLVHDKQDYMNSLRAPLTAVESQILELRLRIEHLRNQVHQTPVEQPVHDALPLLYQRLDEIDNQIRRWRQVQTDVHQERVRLRDEMATCDRLSIESADHPYHVSRELVVGLESKVDATENIARRFDKLARTSNVDPTENWDRVVELCSLMRDDLYSLCQELGRQYKHIRHKAAVAEMKQLRRCYHEMDENIKRLVRRRENVLCEIRQLDPAGAEAIELAETQFCDCAEHDGYLEARRRFVGSVHNEVRFTTQTPDWSLEQRQLDDLETQRSALLHSFSVAESDLSQTTAELNRLVGQKSSLALSGLEQLHSQLNLASEHWLTVDQQIRELMLQIEEDRQLAQYQPDTFMKLAANNLSMLTNGQLAQPTIDEQRQLLVVTQQGTTQQFHQIDRGHQDLVCLSLIAAAVRTYAEKGVRLPLVVDNLFVNLDANERRNAMSLLVDIARDGQQIIALTNDREMMNPAIAHNHLQNIDVRNFDLAMDDLPDTYIARPLPEQFVSPRSAPNFPTSAAPFVSGNMQYSSPTSTPQIMPVRTVVNTTSQSVSGPILNESTRLSDVDLVESIYDTPLSQCGVNTIGELLSLDPEDLASELSSRGFLGSQIDRWQAQAWLMVCLPELKSHDARILVACGITEPEQLDSTSSTELLDRIKQYLGSSDGRRAGVNLTRYDSTRFDGWKQSIRNTRSRWSLGDGYSRRRQRRSGDRNSNRTSANRPFHSDDRQYSTDRQYSSDRRAAGADFESRDNNLRDNNQRDNDRGERNGRSNSDYTRTSSSNGSIERKFYLEMSDDIEAAPSIGARTAERFYKIGVKSISDFLNGDAKTMADKLKYKRISAKVIGVWQHQTQLMVQVPNMRVHDVQLLVACGLTEASQIAAMEPQQLFGIVKPFSETKDGERILRSGKKPDLNEIKEWIDSANHKRSLQAA